MLLHFFQEESVSSRLPVNLACHELLRFDQLKVVVSLPLKVERVGNHFSKPA